MYFQRYYLDCLSHASYLIGDETTSIAAVVDPQRDIDIYVDEARERGFTIKHAILTHFHADFVSGHIEMRDRLGAQIHLGARGQAEFEFRALADGDAIEFGKIRLEALETPGHTPEAISILVYDQAENGEEPYAVLTGDTLFLGDVGRPDLFASIGVTAEELAGMLHDSLHNKLLKLPDSTLVYPAHGAGSMCGKQLSDEAVSTLGEQRRYNYALQPMTKEAFIELVTADQPEAPEYFAHDAMLNRQDRPSLETSLRESLNPLDLDKVLSMQKSGAQIVDVREPLHYASAHLRGSINIPLDGRYASWAGTLLRKDLPIVIVADEDRTEEAVLRLGRIGFDQVEGYLDQGMRALERRSDLLGNVDRVSATAVPELPGEITIVDVRTQNEWEAGHVEGSLNIPLNQLVERVDNVPTKGQIVVHCQGGYRSSIAVSLLKKLGHHNVFDLIGGYKAWTVAWPSAGSVSS